MDLDKTYCETNLQNGEAVIIEAAAGDHKTNSNAHIKKSEKSHLKTLSIDKHYLIDDDDQISTNQGAPSRNTSRWRIAAVVISWFSIAVTLAIGIAEFIVAKREDSSAAFGLAFDAILDVLTSAVVLWRYYRANDTFSQMKEHLSCLILGILFIVSAIGIAAKAIFSLLDGDMLDMSEQGISFLLTTTSIAAAFCALLFAIKILIAKKLSSWTMLSDALNSLMGGIIAMSMIITVQVTKSNPYLWYLDPTVGLSVSLFLLVYGIWLMFKHIPRLQATISYKRTK